MIALKISVFFLLLTVITAADPKDKPFRDCCQNKGVHAKFLDSSCTYSALYAGTKTLVDDDFLADLPAIIECSADGKDNTECCKGKGVSDACLGSCNASPPVELAKFAACWKESKEQKRKVLDCSHENAYN
ncbi:DB module domain-containing protein [Ditylenchus destructor]|uniref:DB module domain-containing protein n=1 Tax=Ditylenchus destructor TaxID=166010 RepID=A0AAD4QXT8_9BILA|nr:DB module domain-containing protein [Ditylenchus destructor]